MTTLLAFYSLCKFNIKQQDITIYILTKKKNFQNIKNPPHLNENPL